MASADRDGRFAGALRRLRSPATLVPILVDVFGRDGSTLMMRLLATSPQIAVEAPYPYERKYFTYLWRWSRLLAAEDWPEGDWGPEQVLSISQGGKVAAMGPIPWKRRSLLPEPEAASISRRCFDAAWSEFSRLAADRTGALHGGRAAQVRYYAEKHLNTYEVDLGELPPVKVIAMLRDPRDTYLSIKAFNRKRGSPRFGRDRFDDETDWVRWMIRRHKQRLRWISRLSEGDDAIVVRYPELVRDLPSVARRLAGWLSVSIDPTAVGDEGGLPREHATADTPEGSLNRWREELPDDVARIFRSELGEELVAVGLEP